MKQLSLPKAARDELNIPEDAGNMPLPSRGGGSAASEAADEKSIIEERKDTQSMAQAPSQPNLPGKDESIAEEEDRASSMRDGEDEKVD